MKQAPLFENLPTTAPAAAEEPAGELPGALRQLLAAGLPGHVVEALFREYAGTVPFVPKPGNLPDGHHLVKTLGREGAEALSRLAGGTYVCVPKGAAAARQARNAAIRRDYDALLQQGKSDVRALGELCRRYDLASRQLWTILGSG